MTVEFDMLATIRQFSENNPNLKPMTEWLAEICVADADRKKGGN